MGKVLNSSKTGGQYFFKNTGKLVNSAKTEGIAFCGKCLREVIKNFVGVNVKDLKIGGKLVIPKIVENLHYCLWG